nr:unnamed protein product [Digitaria exilis]
MRALLLGGTLGCADGPPGLDIFEYNMSEKSSDAATGDLRPEGDVPDQNGRDGMPSLQQEDHERAYFDSADWALGKQGGNPQKPKGPLEALRPKLQVQKLNLIAQSVHSPTEDVSSPTENAGQNQNQTEGKDKE